MTAGAAILIAWLAIWYFAVGRSKDGGFTFWALACGGLVLWMVIDLALLAAK